MSKPLRRPMFRMGGSPNTNSGIVSGFAQPRRNFQGGSGLEPTPPGFDGSAEEDDILAQTLGTVSPVTTSSSFGPSQATIDAEAEQAKQLEGLMAEKPSGLSAGDWLRIAAAGGEILGAEGRGSGLKGALAAAGPALSGLGKDLATSTDARQAAYQKQKAAYDSAKLGIATSNVDRSFQSDEKQKDRDVVRENLLFEIENGKYNTDYKTLLNERAKANQAMLDAIEAGNKEKYDKAANEFDNTYPEEREIRSKMAIDLKDSDIYDKYEDRARELIENNSSYKGRNIEEVANELYFEELDDLAPDIYKPPFPEPEIVKKADGGRIGYAMGSGPYEPGSGPNPDPGSPPVMQAQQTGITFQELRARLPKEVSDAVVKLLATSEVALLDFANIATQEDMTKFNQKYNSDLQLPAQGA
jgi:hypothetical protein